MYDQWRVHCLLYNMLMLSILALLNVSSLHTLVTIIIIIIIAPRSHHDYHYLTSLLSSYQYQPRHPSMHHVHDYYYHHWILPTLRVCLSMQHYIINWPIAVPLPLLHCLMYTPHVTHVHDHQSSIVMIISSIAFIINVSDSLSTYLLLSTPSIIRHHHHHHHYQDQNSQQSHKNEW